MATRWRECATWLRDSRVLPESCSIFTDDDVTSLDLIKVLMDGVVLCSLASQLLNNDPDLRKSEEFCAKPQNSQFLCYQNIRLFLQTCQSHFEIEPTQLFQEDDLYHAINFGKVIDLLQLLAHHELAISKRIRPFPYEQNDDDDDAEVEQTVPVVENLQANDSSNEIVYESVIAKTTFKKGSTKNDLRYEYCVKELIETEDNYIKGLQTIINDYMIPLQITLSQHEINEVFEYIPEILAIHQTFSLMLHSVYSGESALTFSQVFITYRDKMLIYGRYSGHCQKACNYINELMHNSPEKRLRLKECQENSNLPKFALDALLLLPIQRVTKYHLMIGQLQKLTDESSPEKSELSIAWEAMKELCDFTNVVNADCEATRIIERIQSKIRDIQFPENRKLSSYGRRHLDGELKVATDSTIRRPNPRYLFLFDRLLLVCKMKSDAYIFMEAYSLSEGVSYGESNRPEHKRQGLFAFTMPLTTSGQAPTLLFFAKSEKERQEWLAGVRAALDNLNPPGAKWGWYHFQQADLEPPSYCVVCSKLIKGVFFSGYKCLNTGKIAHKECLTKIDSVLPNCIESSPFARARISNSGAVNNNAASNNHHQSRGNNNNNNNSSCNKRLSVQPPPTTTRSITRKYSNVSDHSDRLDFSSGDQVDLHGKFLATMPFDNGQFKIAIEDELCIIDTEMLPSRNDSPSLSGMHHHQAQLIKVRNITQNCEGFVPRSFIVRPSAPARRLSEQQLDSSIPGPELYDHYSVDPNVRIMLHRKHSQVDRPIFNHSNSNGVSYREPAAPRSNRVSIDMTLRNLPGFLGCMSREVAKELLQGLPNGSYIIRYSDSTDRKGLLSLTVVYQIPRPIRIEQATLEDGSMVYFLEDRNTFTSVGKLIAHYSDNSLRTVFDITNTRLLYPYVPQPEAKDVLFSRVANYSYSARDKCMLSFTEGERVLVLSLDCVDEGYWKAWLNHRVGFVPINHFE